MLKREGRTITTEKGNLVAIWTEVTPIDKIELWVAEIEKTDIETLTDRLCKLVARNEPGKNKRELMYLSGKKERIKNLAEKKIFGRIQI